MLQKLYEYVELFDKNDEETVCQLVSNSDALEFLKEQIPLIDCPDRQIEETYYFRFWTFRKHLKKTDKGYIFTEFLNNVSWSGPYNSINCPACFHIREGRWLKGDFVRDYIDFWLNEDGDLYKYSAWYAHAVLEYATIKNDFSYAIEKLPGLIKFYETREKTNKRACGLYWSHDDRDGMEFSISSSGLRPTLNSYVYADAMAISRIAEMAGDLKTSELYIKKAEHIKNTFEALLWDKDFYKTIPLKKEDEGNIKERPFVEDKNNVKELVGFIPWYFNMPNNHSEVFKELLNKNSFYAPFGLTTAEQSHPRFLESFSHECLWNGYVWPFATSQVLVALSNLLRNYSNSSITKNDYYNLLLQYAKSHYLTKEDGSKVNWIDENMHPYTGVWQAREILKNWGFKEQKGGYERGKDYNHSLFCDLVLSGLFGIDVSDGEFTVNPLIPDFWDYFMVENLWLNNKRYRIIYDKTGKHYNLGKGIIIKEY